jgi:hypothetical protein
VQAGFIEDNFKSIYFPTLLKAAGFLPTAFFLTLQTNSFLYTPLSYHAQAGCFTPSPVGEGWEGGNKN